MRKNLRPIRANRQAGFTLVELMVSLVLGMIVTAAAIAMFLSNKQVYATNEHLGRAQENVRTAYELMSREMREASGSACESNLRTVNLLRNPATNWWSTFDNRVRGYNGATAFADAAFGTAAGSRIAGTEAIELKSGVSDGVSVVSHAGTNITVNTVNHGFATGDIVVVCDFDHASIAQVTAAADGTTAVLAHAQGGAFVPGNCSAGLGFQAPPNCSVGGVAYSFPALSTVAHMHMSRWYIGAGTGGVGRSLYQSTLVNVGGTPTVQLQEIAQGVQNMELMYLVRGAASYVNAAAVGAQWDNVVAVRVVLTVQVEPNGDGGDVVTRRLEHTVALRNRMT